jgi:hypothetical protein
MSKTSFVNIKTLASFAVCAIGMKLIFNKINKHHCSMGKFNGRKELEKFDLHSELSSFKAETSRVVESLSKLREVKSVIDVFMKRCEGQIHPHFLYKITKNDNISYLLGTNHGIPPIVFNRVLYKYLDSSDIFVTEIDFVSETEEGSMDKVVVDQVIDLNPAIIVLPNWSKKLSKYDRKFLVSFLQEANVSLNNNASPERVFDIFYN